jgi:hypothetical protein
MAEQTQMTRNSVVVAMSPRAYDVSAYGTASTRRSYA